MTFRRSCTALLSAILVIGCHRAPERETTPVPIILISIDTLRSDHLPAYGYRGVQTPAIDALRRDSVLFEHAYSHVPLTLPSHATMLTGRLPAENGLRDNVGFSLDPKVPTLAESLRANGYRTGAAVSAFVLRGQTGIARGFEWYDDHVEATDRETPMAMVQRRGGETERLARTWVTSHAHEPFFLMLHLYEPHTPYDPPEPFKSRYHNPYDGEIAAVDQIVGDFLQFLRDQGLYDRALILLVSDHGEGLGDHGEDEHGIFLYREAIQVPLFLKLPHARLGGRSVATPVQLSDLFPTVLQQAGIKSAVPGRSLIDIADGHAADARMIYSETYYPRYHFGWSDLHAMTDGAKQAIHAPQPELYDLVRDPAERTNVIDSDRRNWNRMDAAMQGLIGAAAAPAPIAAEDAAKLAALGYLSSSVATDANAPLPDPKSQLGTFREIKEAFALYRQQQFAPALTAFRQILAKNPRMVDVWDVTTRSLVALGRNDEAIAAAKEGLRVAPNATQLAIQVANLEVDRDPVDAARHAELAVKVDPARAHEILARIALKRGDVAGAESEARQAIAGTGERIQPLLTLARIQLRRNDPASALQTLDEASRALTGNEAVPPTPLLLRGDALARLGRNAEAETAMRESIRLAPTDPAGYESLIVLLATEGKNEEGTQLIYELAGAIPTPAGYAAIVRTLDTLGDHNGAQYWSAQAKKRFGG